MLIRVICMWRQTGEQFWHYAIFTGPLFMRVKLDAKQIAKEGTGCLKTVITIMSKLSKPLNPTPTLMTLDYSCFAFSSCNPGLQMYRKLRDIICVFPCFTKPQQKQRRHYTAVLTAQAELPAQIIRMRKSGRTLNPPLTNYPHLHWLMVSLLACSRWPFTSNRQANSPLM